ncbi:hypothetical protein FRC09_010770, partial [Ceratobasidium sp. 395]
MADAFLKKAAKVAFITIGAVTAVVVAPPISGGVVLALIAAEIAKGSTVVVPSSGQGGAAGSGDRGDTQGCSGDWRSRGRSARHNANSKIPRIEGGLEDDESDREQDDEKPNDAEKNAVEQPRRVWGGQNRIG